MQKLLILLGCLLIIIGIALPWLQRLGLGQLPGDIMIKRGHVSFYFPLATCIILSLILSVLLRILNK